MKKPADSNRGNPEGPELDEFSKLQQQYDEASAEERERLWPDLIRAIRKIDPSFLQKFERAFRSGDYLKAQVESAMKRALARADLRPGGKTNAEEEATAVHFIFNELEAGGPWGWGNQGVRVRTGDPDPVHRAVGRPQPQRG